MDMGLIFWVIMLLWLLSLLGSWTGWQGPWVQASSALEWILFCLLGWKVFGPMIH